MSDTFKPTPADNYTSSSYGTTSGNNGNKSYEPAGETDMGRTLLVGVVGGLLSAAGFLVYQRLPDDQKEKLQGQVKGMLAQRISELRNNFNI
ncbi:MAG: hypothetical protein M3126_08785 [Candidatus Eremiobacteraeota bacterium]|nr:hypothetical protein [Candidatus Eremiobacteraeota bacterium]